MAAIPPEGGRPTIRYADVWRAGFYTLRFETKEGGTETEVHAYNIRPEEGNLAGVSDSELRSLFGPVPFRFLRGRTAVLEEGEDPGREIWKPLILMLVGLLVLEGVLALKFGHHQAGLAP